MIYVAKRPLKRPIQTTIVGKRSAGENDGNPLVNAVEQSRKRMLVLLPQSFGQYFHANIEIGSRLDTVAINCLRTAMENEFPMVATTLATFSSSHTDDDTHIEALDVIGSIESSSPCSSSLLASTPLASVTGLVF